MAYLVFVELPDIKLMLSCHVEAICLLTSKIKDFE